MSGFHVTVVLGNMSFSYTTMRLITGAWKSTPIQALYCEAGVLPTNLQRDVSCATAYARLKASPEDHPIHKTYRRDHFFTYMEFGGKQYREPLLYRVHRPNNKELTKHTDKLELRKPPALPPWWPLAEVVHSKPLAAGLTKEAQNAAAIIADTVDRDFPGRRVIYMDGSVIRGNNKIDVGAGMYVAQTGSSYRWIKQY